ncbi:MAG: phage holin family protein [Flavobacteriales bacterium]|nr:phage holin family protein [Flavobacteriales bacterium]
MKRIIKFLLLAGVVYLCAQNLSGISVDGYKSAVIATLVLTIVNMFIKPVLKFISFPITVITLGLFLLVINAMMVLLMDYFVGGFSVNGFWWAAIFSIIIAFSNSLLNKVLDDDKKEK